MAGIGVLDSLSRMIKEVRVKPRFLIAKTSINFGKKVIAKGSKPMSHPDDVNISNPDHVPLTWSIDKEVFDSHKVFQISQTD